MAFVPTSHRLTRPFQKEIGQGKNGDDSLLPENRFLELKALRPSQRAHAIRNKLIADPENRTDLTGAITVVGTCLDMCPEFERHEREYQKDVDEWEKIPGTNPKRIDHTRAVKKYRRSAAGNEDPLPSDLRPPHILKKTLDYLLEDLLPRHGLAATYAFIRDRTRAIRTDFVIQHIKGPSAIECFERIARFHILAVHAFCDGEGVAGQEKEEVSGFDYWLEVEQMMKTLQSLIQFYDDRPVTDPQPPNEAEFRAYYLLAHIRSNSILRRLHTLPQHIFLSPIIQSAMEFRAHAQSLSASTISTQGGPASGSTHKSRTKSLAASPPLQNFFTRFFKRIADPATSYLFACLLEYHFGGVRKGAVHALWKAYSTRHRGVPIPDVGRMLGFSTPNDTHIAEEETKVEEVVKKFGMRVEVDNEDGKKRIVLNRLSTFEQSAQITQRHSSNLVEPKRGRLNDVEIVNGNFEKAQVTWKGVMQVMPTMTAASSFVTAPPSIFLTPASSPAHGTYPPFPSPSVSGTQTNGMPANQPPHVPSIGGFFKAGIKHPPLGGHIAPAFAFKRMDSVPVYVPPSIFTSPSVIPPAPRVHSQGRQPVATEISLDEGQGVSEQQSQQQLIAQKNQEEKVRAEEYERELRAQMKERRHLLEKENAVVEEAKRQKEQEERQREEMEKERRKEEERERKEKEEEELRIRERKYQEQLKQQRKERTRIADLWFISRVFDRWKRVVIKRGEVRRAFKKSVLEMGSSADSSNERAAMNPRKDREVEDVISWEDMSEFSVPESHLSDLRRRRRSKGRKRMDDEMILASIRDAEKARLRLWEPGTFLRFVKETQCRGDIWLSTSPQSTSTGQWLRVKFDVQTTVGDEVICIPHGDGHGPGLIIIDLTPGHDESVIQRDIHRLRHIFSRLPSDRHYIPSVLILQWTGYESLPAAISTEVNSLLEQQIILSVRILAFNNDDLNDQFLHTLKEILFDTVGKLVRKASVEEIFAIFLKIWDSRLTEALGSCQLESSTYSIDWSLYGQIVEIFINLLQKLAEGVAKTCQIEVISDPWPMFDGSAIVDERSAFQTFIEYIEFSWLAFEEPAIFLKAQLTAAMKQNKEFDVRSIPSRVAHFVLFKFQTSISAQSHFHVDAHEPLPSVLEFSEAVCSAYLTMDENLVSQKNTKKRNATEDRYFNSNGSLSKRTAKRYKQDDVAGIVNADDNVDHLIKVDNTEQPSVNKPDALTRLRSSIVKAKQSVQDLRAVRENGKENATLEPESPSRSDVDPVTWISSESPSFLFKRKRIDDNLDLTAFYPRRPTPDVDRYRSSDFLADDPLLRTAPPDSLGFQPLSTSRDGYDSSSASLQKPIASHSTKTNDKLMNAIERAKRSIQEARKSRQK